MMSVGYKKLSLSTKNKVNLAVGSVVAVGAIASAAFDRGELARLAGQAWGVKPSILTNDFLTEGAQAVGGIAASFLAAHAAGALAYGLAEWYANTHNYYEPYKKPLVNYSTFVSKVSTAAFVALHFNTSSMSSIKHFYQNFKWGHIELVQLPAGRPLPDRLAISRNVTSPSATLG